MNHKKLFLIEKPLSSAEYNEYKNIDVNNTRFIKVEEGVIDLTTLGSGRLFSNDYFVYIVPNSEIINLLNSLDRELDYFTNK